MGTILNEKNGFLCFFHPSCPRGALEYNIPYTITLAAARATLDPIRAQKRGKLEVKSLQEYNGMIGQPMLGGERATGKN